MKTWALLCTCVFVLGLTLAARANDEGDAYDMMLMKPAIAANMALQKNVGTDLAAADKDAGDLQAAFAKIEGYWSKKGGADDAVMFAKNIEKAAGEVKDAAGKGDKDAAAAAAKMIAPNCGGCHMAHRTKTASGFDLH